MPTTISGSTGVTYPNGGLDNTTGAGVGTTDTQTLTNKTLGSGLVAGASYLTSGTTVASTSGTSIDFTSIPSWVKRITVMFNGVSTTGTSDVIVQIGSGSIDTAGYSSGTLRVSAGATFTTGFGVTGGANTAAILLGGAMQLLTIGSNIWVASGATGSSSAGAAYPSGGYKSALSGTIDRVRITTVGGTDTFDAGSINILYE